MAHQRRTVRGMLALSCVATLAGCSASGIFSPPAPASPDPTTPTQTPSSTVAPEPTHEPTQDQGRNPYENGAERDWAVPLAEEPVLVAFDRQASTVVVAMDDDGATVLTAFEVSSSGRTLMKWTYDVPEDQPVKSLDALSGKTYLSVGDREQAATDLIILQSRNGDELYRWTTDNPLDQDIPEIVGAYDSGLGVIKEDRDLALAAIVNESGRVIDDGRVILGDEQAEIGHDMIRIGDAVGSSDFVFYPELERVSGDECYSLEDGLVCIEFSEGRDTGDANPLEDEPVSGANDDSESNDGSAATAEPADQESPLADQESPVSDEETEQSSQEESLSSASESDGEPEEGQTAAETTTDPEAPETDGPEDEPEPTDNRSVSATRIVEYDRSGFQVRITEVDATSAAHNFALFAMDHDTDTRELASALAEQLSALQQSATPQPAMLSDGRWVPHSRWQLPEGVDVPANADLQVNGLESNPLFKGAPFIFAGEEQQLINALTGEAINGDGTTAIVGSGHSADMFFEWDGEELYYLRPLR